MTLTEMHETGSEDGCYRNGVTPSHSKKDAKTDWTLLAKL